MALYDRLRIIDLESRCYQHDVAAARQALDSLYRELGAQYAGYIVEDGCGVCHQWLLSDTSDASLARVLLLAKRRNLRLYREHPLMGNPKRFSIETIVEQIAKTIAPAIVSDELLTHSPSSAAEAWSGVRVLANMASA